MQGASAQNSYDVYRSVCVRAHGVTPLITKVYNKYKFRISCTMKLT